MIKILSVLCCFLCVQEEPVMSWSDSYKLSWSDFKGQANNKSNAVAITASGISFGFSIKQSNARVISFTTQVHAHFYPEQSWYKPKLADAHILEHEQLHFDITELFVRKFRYRISKLKVSNSIRTTLKHLQNSINKELEKVQDNYDRETNNSINIGAQAKWKVYIATELKKFSNYKSVE